jgi:hypothetical protein
VSTLSIKVGSNAIVRVILVVGGRVDTDLDPGEETVLDGIAEVEVF